MSDGLLEKPLGDVTEEEWERIASLTGVRYNPKIIGAAKLFMPRLFERTISDVLAGLPKLLASPGGEAWIKPLLGQRRSPPPGSRMVELPLMTQCPFCHNFHPVGVRDGDG